MKKNVGLLTNLRRPLRSILFLILFGLVTFGFMTKALQFILIQRETGVLGSYYRSIGVLNNINDSSTNYCNRRACVLVKDLQAGDISAGIDLILTSLLVAYGDQREIVSGVMENFYNENRIDSDTTTLMEILPSDYWPKTFTYDFWFTGDLILKEEVMTREKLPEDQKTIGYYLKFNIDTLLASDPNYAKQGKDIALLFLFEGHESGIPSIQAMVVGQRYLIRGRDDYNYTIDTNWINVHFAYLEIKPLDDKQLWYIPIAKGTDIDFSDPVLTPFKNKIDILNENLHTLYIIATADMSAIPSMQESSRHFYLSDGRWLNHQDDLDGKKVIVVPNSFAYRRKLELGDEITFTIRPLTDTFVGLIRDGVDSLNWRSYPTYQDTFTIVGIYNSTNNWAIFSYIPTSSIKPGFTSKTQNQFYYEEYNFVLNSSRDESAFIQEYKEPLQALGISLTFLPNNGPAYWAAVDPIRQSLAADLLVFSLLMVGALLLVVILFVLQGRKNYAILRALGLPKKQANRQTIFPLLLLGEIGIISGGYSSWQYAINQAKESLSSLPLPSGVTPSADLSPMILVGLCVSVFLLLALFVWLAVLSLSRKPVLELLQGEASRASKKQKRSVRENGNQSIRISTKAIDEAGSSLQTDIDNKVRPIARTKYTPFTLSRYVLYHILRSRIKSFLVLVIAMVFVLAAGWIQQTMMGSLEKVDNLYDTTVVEADILPFDSSLISSGKGFIFKSTVDSVMDSGFVDSSVLEAASVWYQIINLNTQDKFPYTFSVYAYDSPDRLYSGLASPGSLIFASGWDIDSFTEFRSLEDIQADGVPAILPTNLTNQLELTLGEMIRITDQSSHGYNCTIVGQYDGFDILIPLSALEAMDGSSTMYTKAHFALDPSKNRQLEQLRTEMDSIMELYKGQLNFVIWDEELRLVITQLEKNLSLLKVLYPVVIAVSILIGAGLSFLLLLQSAKDAAILRIQGTTKTAVRSALIVEPFLLSIIGSLLGLGIAILLWMRSDAVSAESLLLSTVLYLAGVVVGSVIGAISVTNKKPIELLQVKE